VSQQVIVLVEQSEEGEVAGDDGVGVAREVGPESLVFLCHDDLVNGLASDHAANDRREREDEDEANEHANHPTGLHHAVATLPLDSESIGVGSYGLYH
jgi:hypothetical protein